MSKVTLQGHIVVPEDDLAHVQAELPRHIELSKKEEGCLVFLVSQDEKHRNIFNVYEEFVDRAAFDAHQARVKSSVWGKVTANVERQYTTTNGV